MREVALRAFNETRGLLLAERTLEARSMAARLKGLLGRDSLPRGEALWIGHCNSIHTFFMRFPIDVLFLDAERRVVRAIPRLPPWRATRVYLAADSVLELWCGALEETSSRDGDRIGFRDV
ncbi:MAG: DUF192 domain-containing protein [Deltaproteobacteria bacterium]